MVSPLGRVRARRPRSAGKECDLRMGGRCGTLQRGSSVIKVTALKDKTCHLLVLKVHVSSEVRGTSSLLSSTTPTVAASLPVASHCSSSSIPMLNQGRKQPTPQEHPPLPRRLSSFFSPVIALSLKKKALHILQQIVSRFCLQNK